MATIIVCDQTEDAFWRFLTDACRHAANAENTSAIVRSDVAALRQEFAELRQELRASREANPAGIHPSKR